MAGPVALGPVALDSCIASYHFAQKDRHPALAEDDMSAPPLCAGRLLLGTLTRLLFGSRALRRHRSVRHFAPLATGPTMAQ
jgi:hypothetical protein